MITLIRTNSENSDFVALVKLLDADLSIRDGDEHAFYSQFNKIDMIKYVIVAFIDSVAVGCGAIKEYEPNVMEIKRMYVSPAYRGKGIATTVLSALEIWAKELAITKCVLETGTRQPEAIALYKKTGYIITPNYGQYVGMANSVCFEKIL